MQTPPLRLRREDILELALFFVNQNAERAGKSLTHIEPEAVEMLMAYDWPGNCRELENVIEPAVILADGPALTVDDLPPDVRLPGRHRFRARVPVVDRVAGRGRYRRSWIDYPPPGLPRHRDVSTTRGRAHGYRALAVEGGEPWDGEYLAYERQRLVDALNEAAGNKSVAARLLAMPRSTFFSKLKKHGIV